MSVVTDFVCQSGKLTHKDTQVFVIVGDFNITRMGKKVNVCS